MDEVDLGMPLAPNRLDVPHSASGEVGVRAALPEGRHPPAIRRWRPKRVVVTPAALEHPHAARILARLDAAGLPVERLRGNRLTGLRGDT